MPNNYRNVSDCEPSVTKGLIRMSLSDSTYLTMQVPGLHEQEMKRASNNQISFINAVTQYEKKIQSRPGQQGTKKK